ncbi:carboxypeptidase-like regulatory domain-containing protein [Seonamhaeicola sp. ML3]|uniref:carboxypeptidase-like regulatory domain-containing protein n=1 Tax=Seonamhaeicola sp. ML3 TaxID=2937786 RepID=UPI00200C51D3|nr:carboxypeptidase-like regulatory domain-containing protein [Seonamhaeicola sp. ML3]
MKRIITLFFFLFAAISFAQNTGMVVGKVLDKEADNTPMAFANVSIKGTSISVSSDFSGMFLLENLEAGDYVLVFNFPGYESKEVKVKVDAINPSEVKLALGAFTLPQTDIASAETTKQSHTLESQASTSSSLN